MRKLIKKYQNAGTITLTQKNGMWYDPEGKTYDLSETGLGGAPGTQGNPEGNEGATPEPVDNGNPNSNPEGPETGPQPPGSNPNSNNPWKVGNAAAMGTKIGLIGGLPGAMLGMGIGSIIDAVRNRRERRDQERMQQQMNPEGFPMGDRLSWRERRLMRRANRMPGIGPFSGLFGGGGNGGFFQNGGFGFRRRRAIREMNAQNLQGTTQQQLPVVNNGINGSDFGMNNGFTGPGINLNVANSLLSGFGVKSIQNAPVDAPTSDVIQNAQISPIQINPLLQLAKKGAKLQKKSDLPEITEKDLLNIINRNMAKYKNISIELAVGQKPIIKNGKIYFLDGFGNMVEQGSISKRYSGGNLKKKSYNSVECLLTMPRKLYR